MDSMGHDAGVCADEGEGVWLAAGDLEFGGQSGERAGDVSGV